MWLDLTRITEHLLPVGFAIPFRCSRIIRLPSVICSYVLTSKEHSFA